MSPMVSVVVCVRNSENNISGCIESILNQTFRNYELILVDDASTDQTSEIISGFKDQRIKYLKNEEWSGIAKSRNRGLRNARGKYFFFTDADCTVCRNWIEEGLKSFADNYDGVEGRIIYVSEEYQPSFSDQIMENRSGGHFMTGNVAYTKDILDATGYFNEKINRFADRELGLRVLRRGKICFNKNMIAIHPKVTYTPKKLIAQAKYDKERPYLFKKFGDKALVYGRVYCPTNLLKIAFPGLIFGSLFKYQFRGKEDYTLLPYTYLHAVLQRLYLWNACAKERVFLI